VGIVIADDYIVALDTLVLLRTQLSYLERVSHELLLSVTLGLRGRPLPLRQGRFACKASSAGVFIHDRVGS
jgi:hypothetical protein